MEALHHTELERLRPVLERYGLVGLEISPVLSNRRDYTAYRVATNAGDVFLKEIPKQQVGLLSLEHRLQQLITFGYAAMPRLYRTSAKRFVTVSGLKKYIVATWVNGTPISLASTAENYRQLGRNLARLHQIPYPARGRIQSANEVRALSFMGEEGRELLRNSKVHRLLINAATNPVLTHSAVSGDNVLVAGHEVLIVSWQHVQPGCSYSEIAKVLIRVAECSPDAMNWILSGYEEVKPLRREERQLILGFFSFPHKSRHIMREAERTAALKGMAARGSDTAEFRQATEWLRSWSDW